MMDDKRRDVVICEACGGKELRAATNRMQKLHAEVKRLRNIEKRFFEMMGKLSRSEATSEMRLEVLEILDGHTVYCVVCGDSVCSEHCRLALAIKGVENAI